MLSPLHAVVPVQFLKGPTVHLSATIGFQEGEVPLERELQTTTFTSLNSPHPFCPASQLTPHFPEEVDRVTVLSTEQRRGLKPRRLSCGRVTGPCSPVLFTRWCGQSIETAATWWIRPLPNPTCSQEQQGMNILQRADSLAECQPLSVPRQGFCLSTTVHPLKEDLSLDSSHPRDNLITYYNSVLYFHKDFLKLYLWTSAPCKIIFSTPISFSPLNGTQVNRKWWTSLLYWPSIISPGLGSTVHGVLLMFWQTSDQIVWSVLDDEDLDD